MSPIKSLAVALIAGCLIAPASLADTVRETRSTSVSYADLDLSKSAGVKTLIKRLRTATGHVCGKRPTSVRYGQLSGYLACQQTAMADAVTRIGNPEVTYAYLQSTGAQATRLASR